MTARFPGNRGRRRIRTRRIDGRHTEVLVERGRAGSRLIPNIDTHTSGNACGLLNRRIADYDIASNACVRRRREHDDAIRVAKGGVFFDQVVIAAEDADAKIVVRSREAVSRRLVPPERVVTALDSYTAAREARLRAAVPDGHVGSESDF